jgi:hypothetical protein
MQRTISLVAAVTIAVVATPALAKSKKHYRVLHAPYAQPYAPFVSRNVSDPSFGYYPSLNYARRSGRCVEDLGYGRFEYCNW